MIFYVVMLFLTAGMALVLAALAWRRRPERGAVLMALLMLSIAITCAAYGMNLHATTLPAKCLWNHAEYLGGVWIGFAMFLLTLLFTGHERWLRPGIILALAIIPAATLLLNWTTHWHHLYYARVWIDASGPVSILAKDRGPLYYPLFIYVYILIFWMLFMLLRHFRRATGIYRVQTVVLIISVLSLILFNVLYTLRLMPVMKHLNLTHFSFFIIGLTMMWGLLHRQFLDLVPVAHDQLFEHFPSAVLVFDAQDRLVDINPAAARLLAVPSVARIVGQPAAELLRHQPAELGQVFSGARREAEFQAGDQTCRARRAPLRAGARSGAPAGCMLIVDDVTEKAVMDRQLRDTYEKLRSVLQTRETELVEATRKAMHAAGEEARRIGQDIHDGLCQELVGLARQAETLAREHPHADETLRQALAGIQAQAGHLARMAREYSHELTLHILNVQTLPEALDVLAERMAQLFRVMVEINISSGLDFLNSEQAGNLYRIIREGIANAIRHANARRIWVDITQQDGSLVVSVSSDGQPPPPADQIQRGLGLEQIQMRARLLGAAVQLLPGADQGGLLKIVMPLPPGA